jgi:23S rRNA pseudouridine1911/1915/1917 synthase
VRAGGEPSIAAADVVRRGAREAVVVKPAGLSSEAPGAGRPGAPRTLIEQVRTLLGWPDAQLPHRLDRPTRGFVVLARDRAAVAAHNEAIRAGLWTKRYLARVRPAAGTRTEALVGEHRAYLRREGSVARVVRSGGDPSMLSVEAVAPAPGRGGEFHAVVLLGTGRYHQVRAMLAHLGAPLVGDRDYGGAAGPMFLEHAWLAFPSADDGVRRVHWRADDRDREPVDGSLVARLSACP